MSSRFKQGKIVSFASEGYGVCPHGFEDADSGEGKVVRTAGYGAEGQFKHDIRSRKNGVACAGILVHD